MAEYIDRENYCKNVCLCNEKQCEKEKCSIHTAPTADVAEVVRCKDCVNYTYIDAYSGRRLNFHFCKKFYNITLESDFCSYGEQKAARDD